MHDDLTDEFEIYPTAKEMWDNIRSRYSQTSETRLCALSSQVPSSFPIDQLCELLVCSHAFVAKSFPNWIVDSGASKHVVQDQVGFVDFHPYPLGLQIVTLRNGTAEDFLGVGTYRLKLRGGNSLLLHDTLYVPGLQCSLVSYVSLMKLGFSICFSN